MFDVSQRVSVLRQEILDLKTANQIRRNKTKAEMVADRQRRELRLKEIQSELHDLLRRLKPEG